MMIDTADVMVIGTTKLCGGVMMTTTLRCYVLGYGGDYYSFLSYDVMMIDTADMLWWGYVDYYSLRCYDVML